MKLLGLLVVCGAALAEYEYVCFKNLDPGPCSENITRYYFESDSNTCKPFTYGGCEGNDNNYETYEQCKASCYPTNEYERKCLARPERGPCLGSTVFCAYEPNLGKCIPFEYGGCDGNANKHITMRECKTICEDLRQEPSRRLIGRSLFVSTTSAFVFWRQ